MELVSPKPEFGSCKRRCLMYQFLMSNAPCAKTRSARKTAENDGNGCSDRSAGMHPKRFREAVRHGLRGQRLKERRLRATRIVGSTRRRGVTPGGTATGSHMRIIEDLSTVAFFTLRQRRTLRLTAQEPLQQSPA